MVVTVVDSAETELCVGKGRFEVGRRILGHLRLIQKDNVNGSQATLAFMTSLLTNNDVSP